MLFNTKFILFSIWSIVTFSVCVNFQCPKRSLYIQRERALMLTVYTVALFISLLFNIATYFKIWDRTIQFFAIFSLLQTFHKRNSCLILLDTFLPSLGWLDAYFMVISVDLYAIKSLILYYVDPWNTLTYTQLYSC